MPSIGRIYVLPWETKSKISKNDKQWTWKSKKSNIVKIYNFQISDSMFLRGKTYVFLDRENWKYKKWKKKKNEKKWKKGEMENGEKNRISDSMFLRGKTFVLLSETKWKNRKMEKRNQKK